MPLSEGRTSRHQATKSDQTAIPIDPSIADLSSTYPPHCGQYSPYPPQQEMSHGNSQHHGGPMYGQPRPNWAGYEQHTQQSKPALYTADASTPTSAAPASARLGQVRPFVIYFPLHFLAICSTRLCCRRIMRLYLTGERRVNCLFSARRNRCDARVVRLQGSRCERVLLHCAQSFNS
jgi:hypothetical protein